MPQYLANQIFDIAIKLNRSDLYSAFIDRFHISATTIEENEIIKHMIQYIEHTVSEIKETNTQKDIETIILKSNQIEAEVKKFDSL
ncbi:MAG: hypothetical protein LBP53_04905 [Candidatus Peribacteria bacterium]|nr:hypothetical protein [Candidatus Peribacteria bacterium]